MKNLNGTSPADRGKMTCAAVVTVLVSIFCFTAAGWASNTMWDSTRQLMLVRGVGVMNSGSTATYFLLLGNPDTSQGTLIMELLEAGYDDISDEAVFYPDDGLLNFAVDLPDGYTYDLWMQLYKGNSGKYFLVLIDFQYYPAVTDPGYTNDNRQGYTTASLSGCFSPDNSGWLTYYCFDGTGQWYQEDWNVISGCTGALTRGTYEVQGNSVRMCDDTGCETHTVQPTESGMLIDGEPYSENNGCN